MLNSRWFHQFITNVVYSNRQFIGYQTKQFNNDSKVSLMKNDFQNKRSVEVHFTLLPHCNIYEQIISRKCAASILVHCSRRTFNHVCHSIYIYSNYLQFFSNFVEFKTPTPLPLTSTSTNNNPHPTHSYRK